MKSIKVNASFINKLCEVNETCHILLTVKESRFLGQNFRIESISPFFKIDDEVKLRESGAKIQVKGIGKEVGDIRDIKIKISSEAPFFIFKTWKYITIRDSVYFYQRTPGVSASDLMSGDGDQSLDFNRYQSGDRLSQVVWKKFYQRGELYTKKQFYDEQSNIVLMESDYLSLNVTERANILSTLICDFLKHSMTVYVLPLNTGKAISCGDYFTAYNVIKGINNVKEK
jgi:uncharacterized protein (DUF58 family)